MDKLTPNLMVGNVKETVEFYRNNLNFNLVMAVPETQDGVLTEIPEDKDIIFALVKNGNIEFQFQSENSLKEDLSVFANFSIGASASFYINVKNIESFYNDVKEKVEVVKELAANWYGMNEFYIRDNNGYVLGFAEQKG